MDFGNTDFDFFEVIKIDLTYNVYIRSISKVLKNTCTICFRDSYFLRSVKKQITLILKPFSNLVIFPRKRTLSKLIWINCPLFTYFRQKKIGFLRNMYFSLFSLKWLGFLNVFQQFAKQQIVDWIWLYQLIVGRRIWGILCRFYSLFN